MDQMHSSEMKDSLDMGMASIIVRISRIHGNRTGRIVDDLKAVLKKFLITVDVVMLYRHDETRVARESISRWRETGINPGVCFAIFIGDEDNIYLRDHVVIWRNWQHLKGLPKIFITDSTELAARYLNESWSSKLTDSLIICPSPDSGYSESSSQSYSEFWDPIINSLLKYADNLEGNVEMRKTLLDIMKEVGSTYFESTALEKHLRTAKSNLQMQDFDPFETFGISLGEVFGAEMSGKSHRGVVGAGMSGKSHRGVVSDSIDLKQASTSSSHERRERPRKSVINIYNYEFKNLFLSLNHGGYYYGEDYPFGKDLSKSLTRLSLEDQTKSLKKRKKADKHLMTMKAPQEPVDSVDSIQFNCSFPFPHKFIPHPVITSTQIHQKLTESADLLWDDPYLRDLGGFLILNGVVGVGKSKLAYDYIGNFKHSYSHIIWINSTDYESLFSSFKSLFQFIFPDIPIDKVKDESSYVELMLESIYHQLSFKKTLIIFDDASSWHDDSAFCDGIWNFILPNPNLFILVLTRRLDFPQIFLSPPTDSKVTLTVPPLTVEQSSKFLLEALGSSTIYSKGDIQEVRQNQVAALNELCTLLEGLPIALRQVITFLNVESGKMWLKGKKMTINQYLELYKNGESMMRRKLMEGYEQPIHSGGMMSTWSMWDRPLSAIKENPGIFQLFYFVCLVGSDKRIKLNYLQEVFQSLEPKNDLHGQLSVLVQYGLVIIEEEGQEGIPYENSDKLFIRTPPLLSKVMRLKLVSEGNTGHFLLKTNFRGLKLCQL